MRVGLFSLLTGLLLVGCTFNAPGLPSAEKGDGPGTAGDAGPADGPDLGEASDRGVFALPDLNRDGPLPDVPSICTEGWFKCVNEDSHMCNPASGEYQHSRDCPLGCRVADGTCHTFKPSSGAELLLGYGQNDIAISDQVVTINTSDGSVSPQSPLIQGALFCSPDQGPCYLSVHVLYIDSKGVLRVEGARPLVIIATGNIIVAGLISASASGAIPGPGGLVGGIDGQDGSGCGGGPTSGMDGTLPSMNGGAGGSFGGGGGAGGGGAPAAASPCSELCPDPLQTASLKGGSGGGGGGFLAGGTGGGGGGALQLSAMEAISISGIVTAGGGAGGGGFLAGSGGGGGSGGGVVIEAPNVEIAGIVAVNGGSGGSGALVTSEGNDGQDGPPSFSAATGGVGPVYVVLTEYKGGNGGSGSDQNVTSGAPGEAGKETGRHGGGGGGAGRICFRTKDGTIVGADRLSPREQGAGVVRFRTLPRQ